jgi:mRNA-degrading endonuclease HigB of HigAB toxin-antitoxin module
MAAPSFARNCAAPDGAPDRADRWSQQGGGEKPGLGWRRIIEKSAFADFAALRRSFRAVDKVGDKLVFNIGGNKWRLIPT